MESRVCRACGLSKPTSEFFVRNRNRIKDGVAYIYVHVSKECKVCENTRRTEYGRTDVGKESRKRVYEKLKDDPEWIAKQKEYWASDRGKEIRSRYTASDKGKARTRRYRTSDKGRIERKDNWARHREHRSEMIEESTKRGKLTARQWRLILKAYDSCCAYCDSKDNITKDHVTPIAKGGSDTKDNVRPCCFNCNEKKGDSLGWIPKEPKHPLRF